ncbi:MAG: bifunctional riboflavin kinase/FAD synthetase [bacterium]
MNILHSIDELSSLKGPIVLAAGTFDGLHLGHQALIRRAMEEAASVNGTAVVMTFDRHPASVVRPGLAPRLLTTEQAKIDLLEKMEVPALLLLEFTPELASVPAEEFIASLVEVSHPLRMICVGSQWSFGKGGTGTIALLEQMGREQGFSVAQIDPVEVGGSAISSTRIRTAIASGDLKGAASCLGRPYLLMGRVIKGAGLGATIGFPTANLDVDGMQLPPDGVYAVRVRINGEWEGLLYPGVTNIGVRPTVDPTFSNRTIEVHLFDVSRDFVGKELSLEFVKFLRAEQKFSGLEELTAQIRRDCEMARSLL